MLSMFVFDSTSDTKNGGFPVSLQPNGFPTENAFSAILKFPVGKIEMKAPKSPGSSLSGWRAPQHPALASQGFQAGQLPGSSAASLVWSLRPGSLLTQALWAFSMLGRLLWHLNCTLLKNSMWVNVWRTLLSQHILHIPPCVPVQNTHFFGNAKFSLG